jgi:outer membrane immunogenic protein
MHRQLRPILLAISLVSLAGAARADGYDAPSRAAAPVALQVSSWTGFYANGGVGYGMWDASTTTVSPITGACILCAHQDQGGKGWLGEIGLGYDYQFSHNIVAGVFVNYDFTDISGNVQDQGPFFVGDVDQKSAWFIGARAGWLMTPDILNYYGVGWTHAKFDGGPMSFTTAGGAGINTGFALSDVSSSGWFISSGIEVSMHGGWYWRSEYRYAQYGNETFTDTNAAGAQLANITFEPDVQTATSEIVYKFNWGH